MLQHKVIASILCTGIAVAWGHANADDFSARLNGFNEVGGIGAGQTGAILSDATSTLRLDLDKKSNTIYFALSYTTGFSSPITQAHIHFGKNHVGGGIIAFLCSNLANPPAGTKPCPAAPGTVKGALTAASVIGPAPQNISPGDFAGLEEAVVNHTAYANIHTMSFPAGEIRGQIQKGDEEKAQGH